MYLRRCRPTNCKKDHVYWELVESYRTERGPRQRVVAYFGDIAEPERTGVEHAVTGQVGWQSRLFDESPEPDWVEVDTRRVRAERMREFGGYWLGLQASEQLGLKQAIPLAEIDIRYQLTIPPYLTATSPLCPE